MKVFHFVASTALLGLLAGSALAQQLPPSAPPTPAAEYNSPIHFQVRGSSQRLEMIVSTSRILTLEHNVPRFLVNNPELVKATPLSPNQIQLSAIRPGVTQLNLWDENNDIHSLDVIVSGDVRELENLIANEFPTASLRFRPLATSVMISGYVPEAGMVNRIVRMAQDYYGEVINNMTVGGVQQVLLEAKVYEVSRTKLRKLGIDWASLSSGDFVIQGVSGLVAAATTQGGTLTGAGGDTMRFGIVNGNNQFGAYIDALRQNNLVKVLAEPQLVTVSGRPASFNSGGEFPIIVPQGFGTVSVEYREFGTRVDFVPIVLGNGSIRLEVRPQVSEIDPSRSVTANGIQVPGLRTRWVDTAVEMKAGQTLALAGLVQSRTEAVNKGVPWAADLPWVGAAFRKVEETVNEVELLILVTPNFVDAMEPHEVPPCPPGTQTGSPNDWELYGRGYIEVPKCGPCTDRPVGGSAAPYQVYPETVPHSLPPQIVPPQNGQPPVEQLPAGNENAPNSNNDATARNVYPRTASRANNPYPRAPQQPGRYSSGSQAPLPPQPEMVGPFGYSNLP